MNLAQTIPLATSWSMHGNDGMGTGWGIVMIIGMILFWIAILTIPGLLLFGTLRGWPGHREDKPAEILDRRFAEGAISLEEYEQRKQQLSLRAHRPTAPTHPQPPPHRLA